MRKTIDWYHDAAVRSSPTNEMLQVIASARRAPASPSLADREVTCLPLIQHLLSPTETFPEGTRTQHDRILKATHLFCTHKDSTFDMLPSARSFGPAPSLLDPLSGLRVQPVDDIIDEEFWIAVGNITFPQFVPHARLGEHGSEAKATLARPWALRPRDPA